MDKVKEFLSKPKHLYFSVMLMFVLVIGLASVSFSYVSESSNNTTQSELLEIDTRISSTELRMGDISLKANESRTFKISVMSNNGFESSYALNYECDKSEVYVTASDVARTIGAYDVHEIELTVSNFESYPVSVTIGLDTGYTLDDIVSTGRKVVKE